MSRIEVHQLLREGRIEEIFAEFKTQSDNAKLHGYKHGDRKAKSTLQKNDNGEMLIHLLARNGMSQDFQRAFNYGHISDVNATTKDGLSLIHYAINSNNKAKIKHVVGLGANILGLPGGIKGLVEFAVNSEIKEFLNSPEFKSQVNTFKDKAQRILSSNPGKQEASIGKKNGRQTFISAFNKKPLLQDIRDTFRSAADRLREQEEKEFEEAIRNSLESVAQGSNNRSESSSSHNSGATSPTLSEGEFHELYSRSVAFVPKVRESSDESSYSSGATSPTLSEGEFHELYSGSVAFVPKVRESSESSYSSGATSPTIIEGEIPRDSSSITPPPVGGSFSDVTDHASDSSNDGRCSSKRDKPSTDSTPQKTKRPQSDESRRYNGGADDFAAHFMQNGAKPAGRWVNYVETKDAATSPFKGVAQL